MNDDSLRRLLRNSLLGRKAPAGLWERVRARLAGAPRRPLALTLFAAAAILAAAGLKLALRSTPDATPAPTAALPAWIAAAVEQHRGLGGMYEKTPPMAPRELTERVKEQSGQFVDLPGLREAGFEPREVHQCLEKGFGHVIYANTWSKLSCFLFEDDRVPELDATHFSSGDVSVIAVKEGTHLKVWVSELKPSQLSTIALHAQMKRDRMKTTELDLVSAPRIVETVLLGMPGVEDVRFEAGKKVCVEYDEKQTSEDAIRGYATYNGVANWGGEGR
ncbi:MAG TPA: hypothetical protein VF950_18090 [Planctomycetota bacterium]